MGDIREVVGDLCNVIGQRVTAIERGARVHLHVSSGLTKSTTSAPQLYGRLGDVLHSGTMGDSGQGTKYGLLVTPVLENEAPLLGQLSDGAEVFTGRLEDLVPPEQMESWRTWIGTLAWDEVARSPHVLVQVTNSSTRPGVSDAENEALSKRLERAWLALTLVGPERPIWGSAAIITGGLKDGKAATAQTYSRPWELLAPYYQKRSAFVHSWPSFPFQGSGKEAKDQWFARWREADMLLEPVWRDSGVPEILHVAIDALRTGLIRHNVGFRIPDHVRAAECLIGIPKGEGKRTFVERAIKLNPNLAQHWFVGVAVESRLDELFQMRSDCVHGKVPFEALRAESEQGADAVARFEYLAEHVARGSLLRVLRRPDLHPLFASRDALEDAWATGKLPP